MIRRIALVLALLTLMFSALLFVAPAQAQLEEPDIEDFTDDEGNVDLEGYTEALAAFLAQGEGGTGGGLPITGSGTGGLIAIGAGLVLVGGSAIIVARARRDQSEDAVV